MGTTVLGTEVAVQQYYDHATRRDFNAVFHQDYRHVWMTMLPSNWYAHPRKAGNRRDDGTCYYETHHSWGSERQNWPPVCFQYLADTNTKSTKKPGKLFTQEGWLVIDLNRKPVLDYDMPFALSSKMESFLLEAIIRSNYDQGIQVQDLRARMPGTQENDGIRGATLSMQMNRWRMEAGCISWATGKMGSDAMRDYLDALLPQSCRDANSTHGFRNLHAHEIQAMLLLNAGKFPNKARAQNKDFSDKNKDAKFQAALTKYQKLRRAYDGSADLTDAYYKAVANRAERDGRRDSTADPDKDDYTSIGSEPSDSEDGEEYVPINASNPQVLGGDDSESSDSDDDEDFGDIPENNPVFLAKELERRDRHAVRRAARDQRENTPAAYNSPSEGLAFQPSSPQVPDFAEHRQYPSKITPQPIVDFRTLIPSTDAQVELTQMFLEPTRKQYRFLTACDPPETDRHDSYLSAQQTLQHALDHWLQENGERGEQLVLFGLLELNELTYEFNGPWITEAMGEPVDMFRAGNLCASILAEFGL